MTGSINIESESDWNEGETDQDDEPRSETESDDEAFSPLLDHFEKLATPSSSTISDSSKPRSRSGSTTSENEGNGFRTRHRASISAKFLSRSQRAARYTSLKSVTRNCSVKRPIWKYFTNSQENTNDRVILSIKLTPS